MQALRAFYLIKVKIKQEAPSSLYSCACVHVAFCTTWKLVILRCIIYTWRDHYLCNAGSSRVCRDESVTLFRTGSLVTGNGLPPSWKIEAKICTHKFACTNVTPKKKIIIKKKGKWSRNLNSCRYRAWVIMLFALGRYLAQLACFKHGKHTDKLIFTYFSSPWLSPCESVKVKAEFSASFFSSISRHLIITSRPWDGSTRGFHPSKWFLSYREK